MSITLGISGIPSPFYEWDTTPPATPIGVTVTVTAPTGNVTNATLRLSLKYHTGLGNEIIVRQYVKTGLGFPSPSNLTVNFNIQAAYACSDNVQLVAELTSGAGNATTSVGLSISQAVAVYTGGPYGTYLGGDSRNACRWTKETIKLRMCKGTPANEGGVAALLIPYYGKDYDPATATVIKTHDYNLSSLTGLAFENTSDSPITVIQFSNGTIDLKLKMTQADASAAFRLTDFDYSEDIINSSAINVVNPDFTWLNIGNRTAYEIYALAQITASSAAISNIPFYQFPLSDFIFSTNPSGAAAVSDGGFTGSGTLLTNSLIIQYAGVRSGVTLSLTHSGDASACSTSPSFNIEVPVFEFSDGPFARSPKRFYSGENNTFSITAENAGGAVINQLPSNNDWSLSGMQAAVTGKQFVNGQLNLTAQFPVNTIVQDYNLTIQRTTETSLTGTTAIHLVGKVTLDPVTPSGADVTITGHTETQAAGITVAVQITGPSGYYQEVLTTDSTGAFSASFTGLSNGNNYSVTAKEKEDPANSSQSAPRTFNINVAYLPPEITIDLTDGADPVQHLEQPSFIISPPVLEHGTRAVFVNIATASPTAVLPVANLVKPDGTSIAFTLTSNAQGFTSNTLDEGDFNTDGVYTVSVNEYTDSHGLKGGPIVRRFILSQPANRVLQTDHIEGWGLYPREEGILAGGVITGCSENSLLAASERWKEDAGGTAALSVSIGNPLTITSAGGTVKTLSRTYAKIYNSNGGAVTGSAYGYLEAGVTLNVTAAGNTINGKDQYGNTISFTLPGVGIAMRDGPFTMKAVFIKVPSGPFSGMRLAAPLSDGSYCVSGTVVNWTDVSSNPIPLILRLEKNNDGLDDIYRVKYKTAGAADWSDSGLSVPVYRLPNENTANLYQSYVRFGHFDNNNQSAVSTWEFVRYAFYDAEYELGAADTYQIGFETTQIPEDNDTFFRSANLRLKDPATSADLADQPLIGNNWVYSRVFRDITKPAFTGVSIPVKIRYCLADWDDSADNSAAGFFKANFPEYYSASNNRFAPLDPAGSTSAMAMADAASADTGNKTWNFVFNQTVQNNLRRRLFILAYADAPFLPAPKLLSGRHTGDYLINDSPAKDDFRCAVRQFLPDFYIRDLVSDNGTGNSCGSNSPDIRTAVFGGDGSVYNPHDYSNTARYPAGYCRDEAPIATSPFETFNDETPDAADTNNGIKMTGNAWIDNGVTPNSYFNRVWAKLSNRGVIPGPAKIQIFYCDSQLRSDFVPALARDNMWEQIVGNSSLADENKYVQDKFIKFGALAGSAYPMTALEAVPALCGNSTPAGVDRVFPLAEFKWYIPNAANVPSGSNIRHGCLTAFINQPGFTSDVDTARRTDSGPLSGTPDPTDPDVDIWAITTYSNNVCVRNHNIVDATDPSQVNTFAMTVIGTNGSPVNYRESPVNYAMTFPRKKALWGLRVDGKKFYGRLVLKIPGVICDNVRLVHFKEVKAGMERAAGKENVVKNKTAAGGFRFFELQEGAAGEILNIMPVKTAGKDKIAQYHRFKVYFLPHPRRTKKILSVTYSIVLEQTADRKVIGSYTTDIRMLTEKEVKFVGDARKGEAYKVEEGKGNYFDEKTIPYQYRIPYMGAGAALADCLKLDEKVLKELNTPLKMNEMMNPMERRIKPGRDVREIKEKVKEKIDIKKGRKK